MWMRNAARGMIAIITLIAVALLVPIVELGRIADQSSPEIVTEGWSDPILIFLFGAYSSISGFQDRYLIGEVISHSSTLPFLILIALYVLLYFLLTTGALSPKIAFPTALLILIPWFVLGLQTYAVLDGMIVRPVLIVPVVGALLTLLFIQDLEQLRRTLGLSE